MATMMKVEWNTPDKKYHSSLLEHDAAWLLKSSLEDEGYPVGIESMSQWECEQYLKQQLEAAE